VIGLWQQALRCGTQQLFSDMIQHVILMLFFFTKSSASENVPHHVEYYKLALD